MEKAIKKSIMPNVGLTCVRTDKFKSGFFTVSLLTQLCRENASKNALIPEVLRRGCRNYPDMDRLETRLFELFGTVLSPYNRSFGEVHCVGFAAAFPDDKFLPEEDRLLEKAVALTSEILLDPVSEDGLFLSEYVESEKEMLSDRIKSILNDKATYARIRKDEIMFAGENYGTTNLGTLESVQSISAKELFEHYKKLLESSEVQMFYCGSAAPERVEAAVLDAFAKLPRSAFFEDAGTEIRVNVLEAQFIKESMELLQGNLSIGFRLGDIMYNPDYPAIKVFNSLYGGGITSKLFKNVRERLSLCYYASSSCNVHKGEMTVRSGIDFDKYDEALAEILAQLEAVKSGRFSEEELDSAIKTAMMKEKLSLDSPYLIENFFASRNILGSGTEIEDYIQTLSQVTKEQVIKVANSILLDTVYFLTAENKGA